MTGRPSVGNPNVSFGALEEWAIKQEAFCGSVQADGGVGDQGATSPLMRRTDWPTRFPGPRGRPLPLPCEQTGQPDELAFRLEERSTVMAFRTEPYEVRIDREGGGVG